MRKLNQEDQRGIVGGHTSLGGWLLTVFSNSDNVGWVWSVGYGFHDWYGPASRVSGCTYKAKATQYCYCY